MATSTAFKAAQEASASSASESDVIMVAADPIMVINQGGSTQGSQRHFEVKALHWSIWLSSQCSAMIVWKSVTSQKM